MNFIMILILALGLSMDAFAVSISNSMCYAGITRRQQLASAACFGLFQGGMPILGFFAGRLLYGFISTVDHWIALILLGFIGGKMLVEGIRVLRKKEEKCEITQYSTKAMLIQGVATSIDALAVGISFAALAVNIWAAAGIIMLTTFLCCILGGLLGRVFGMLLGDWAQIFGGLILLFIGVNIFVQHMSGG